jgi:hypothetical protein
MQLTEQDAEMRAERRKQEEQIANSRVILQKRTSEAVDDNLKGRSEPFEEAE